MKYRIVKEGEYTAKTDIAKHNCGCYYYETVSGHPEPHAVDAVCSSHKCYRRPLPEPKRRAKMIAVDGHRERIGKFYFDGRNKPARMKMPGSCVLCPFSDCCYGWWHPGKETVVYGSITCKRALRKAWTWARVMA